MKKICDFINSDLNMMLTADLNKKLNIKKDIFLKLLKSNKVNNCIIARCLIIFYFIYFFIITDVIEKINKINELFRKNNEISYDFDYYINLLENINLSDIDFENFLFLIKSNNFNLNELFKNQMNC